MLPELITPSTVASSPPPRTVGTQEQTKYNCGGFECLSGMQWLLVPWE
jgi:hypothetical protein